MPPIAHPRARHDLEFFPARQDGQEFILVRDHLGLSPEGTALGIPLYQFMTLLDGRRSISDLQTIFMRQQGGVFVGSEEILGLLKQPGFHISSGFGSVSVGKRENCCRFYK